MQGRDLDATAIAEINSIGKFIVDNFWLRYSFSNHFFLKNHDSYIISFSDVIKGIFLEKYPLWMQYKLLSKNEKNNLHSKIVNELYDKKIFEVEGFIHYSGGDNSYAGNYVSSMVFYKINISSWDEINQKCKNVIEKFFQEKLHKYMLFTLATKDVLLPELQKTIIQKFHEADEAIDRVNPPPTYQNNRPFS